MTAVRLFQENESLVHYILNRYTLKPLSYKLGYTYEDWTSVGREGLWKASKEYVSKDTTYAFSTIACNHIQNNICRELRKKRISLCPLDENAVIQKADFDETLFSVKEIAGEKEYNILLDYYGHKYTFEYLSEKYDMTNTQLKKLLNTLPRKIRKEFS